MPPEPQLVWGDDRLSALPDDLLHTVLSFLSCPEAVRTCVLSRRWKDLWSTAPSVRIDMREFHNDYFDYFEDFTTNLLLFRSADVSLDRFLLFSSAHGRRRRAVDRWVRRGIKCCPQVLEVGILDRGAFLFPPLGASSCGRLKRLQLNDMSLDRRFAEQIQSNCPVLEELELKMCSHSFHELTTSRALKRLTMDCLHYRAKRRFVITAPSLVYLQICVGYGSYSNGISVHVADSLREADIVLNHYDGSLSFENQRSLLKDLCKVSNLKLNGADTKVLLDEESNKWPIFHNMRSLSLEDCFWDEMDLYDKLEALGSFLQNAAPFLMKLTLQGCMKFGETTRPWLKGQSITLPHQCRKTFQCQSLKLVEVIYKADYDNHLVELLWGIGRVLPNATIKLTKVP